VQDAFCKSFGSRLKNLQKAAKFLKNLAGVGHLHINKPVFWHRKIFSALFLT
jgi:hypothetical protein